MYEKMKSPRISVIVPVYNAEKYLERCIDSILHQTYTNIELILVDDGSTDNSWDIIKGKSKELDSIVIIHQENAGPSAARNNGMRHASGEYIMFCDSDDTVEPEWCEAMVRLALKYPDSLCMSGMHFCDKNGETIHKYFHENGEELLSRDSYWKLFKEGLPGWPVNKIYSVECLRKNDLWFDKDISHGEDVIFNLRYLDCVQSSCATDKVLYNYYHYDDAETLTNRYHVSDFDTAVMLFNERKRYVSTDDSMDFQEYYWHIFSNELEKTWREGSELSFVEKMRHNQSIVSNRAFQELLVKFGEQETNELAYWCLKSKFYFGYWIIQQLHRIKTNVRGGVDNNLSIIVPVYNTERYLHRCITSIITQTYADFELILVDDGSNDGSWNAILEQAFNEPRIIAIRQKNAGPSAARNNGMRHASGEYIMFCDSDDTVEPEWCETMVNLAQEYPNSWIMCGMRNLGEDGSNEYSFASDTDMVLSKDEYWSVFKLGLTGGPCNKIFSKRIIVENTILFDETIKRGEDVIFNLRYLDAVAQIVVTEKVLYNYYHYLSTETLTSCYHLYDFDTTLLMYQNRMKFIANKDFEDYQKHYWGLFSNELERTWKYCTNRSFVYKMMHNQKIVKNEEFQNLLEQFGRNETSAVAFVLLKRKNYYGYWIIQQLSKMKSWLLS